MDLAGIQEALRQMGIDGWLFFDHHQRDPLAYRILHINPKQHVTRRWYYYIPAEGSPSGLVHAIESGVLAGLPGSIVTYSSWMTQQEGLKGMLAGAQQVAMQYSPNCAIPYVSLVDAGTVELVRTLGVSVVSSADLVQRFEALWDKAKLASHLEAGRLVDQTLAEAFRHISISLQNGLTLREWDVHSYIQQQFAENNLITDHGPIVAVNENCSDPHYEPQPEGSQVIRSGDVVLIDLWAKLQQPGSVYYDITWTGFCGPVAPAEVQNVFGIVRQARDRAVHRVQEATSQGVELRGFQVDDAARDHIRAAGYGAQFVHRTGHSIGEEVHGTGVNIDNWETHDERRIVPGSCFSIEPGIYLPHFGIRSEVNVFVDEHDARVTGRRQEELVLIM